MIVIAHVSNALNMDGMKIYCGRGVYGFEQSPLHNPYKLESGMQPGDTLPKFREHLWKAMRSDAAVMDEVQRIADMHSRGMLVVLCCWCRDTKNCHCSVIQRAAEYVCAKDKADEMAEAEIAKLPPKPVTIRARPAHIPAKVKGSKAQIGRPIASLLENGF